MDHTNNADIPLERINGASETVPAAETIGIPDATIETLARGFFRETAAYGFAKLDYVRFVNTLLDMAMVAEPAGPVDLPRQDPAADLLEAASSRLPLVGELVRIRSFEPATDSQLLRSWVSDPSGRFFLISMASSRSLDVPTLVHDDRTTLGIITLHDGAPIGTVAFVDHDSTAARAELRKIIGVPEARGRGYGKEASKLWIEYGKNGMDLRKIYLNTLDTNIRNVRLNEELGFRIEGVLRNEVWFDNAYHDILRMGLWLG